MWFILAEGFSGFSHTKVKRKKKLCGRRETLCDTASVTQINLIKELQHSTAESHIIIQAKMQVYNVVMLKVQLHCGHLRLWQHTQPHLCFTDVMPNYKSILLYLESCVGSQWQLSSREFTHIHTSDQVRQDGLMSD